MKNPSNQPFYVGKWLIEPAINKISYSGEEKHLSPKAMSALLLLANEGGQLLTHEQLIFSLWPTQIVSDSSLYQVIATLRKQLGDSQSERQYIERISGKGYRLIAKISASEPFKKPPNTRRLTRPLLILVTICLLILGIFHYVDYSNERDHLNSSASISPSLNKIKSLTVLPFVSRTADPKHESWVSSLTDALTTQLANIDNLQIIKGEFPNEPIMELASLFGVDHSSDAHLLGRVQQENNRVRINLTILSNPDKTVIWAKEYEGTRDQLFELQDRITQSFVEIFGRKQITLSFNNSQFEQGVFNDYLMGRFQWSKRNKIGLEKAENIFKSVTKQAPNFALGYVGLCDTYQYYVVYSNWSFERSFNQCKPLLDKALSIDPNLGEAIASKAMIAAQQGDLQLADQLFERAIKHAPNYAIAHMWYGSLLAKLGRLSKAEIQQRQAYRLSPLSPIINRKLALALLNQAQIVPARKVYLRALELESEYTYRAVDELDFFDLTIDRAVAYMKWTKEYPDLFEQNPNQLIGKALISRALGNNEQANMLISKAEKRSVSKQWLLFAKAVIAEDENDLLSMEEILLQRMQLQINEQPFVFPYINLLAHLGRNKEALRLAEKKSLIRNATSLVINDKNMTSLMYYAFMLEADDQIKKSSLIFSHIDKHMQENTDMSNVNHLVWLVHKGQQTLVTQQIKQIMKTGWLPNFYGELFSLSQMRYLYAAGNDKLEAAFDKMLKINRIEANEQINSNN